MSEMTYARQTAILARLKELGHKKGLKGFKNGSHLYGRYMFRTDPQGGEEATRLFEALGYRVSVKDEPHDGMDQYEYAAVFYSREKVRYYIVFAPPIL